MADDLVLNAGSGGGTLRAFQDAGDIYWPAGVTSFLTTLGTPDVAVPVLPTQGLPVRLSDGSGYVTTLPVSIAASVAVTGTFWQTTQPVSLASIPLATDAATATLQGTGNTSLASIDAKTPSLGQALAAASVPVVLTAAQLSTLTPPAAIAGFATAANQTTELASLASIDGKLPALSGGSVPVTGPLTDTQLRATAVPVSDGGGSLTVDGSVSVSGVVAGTSATSLGKAEDAVAADGDTGVMALAVRKDTAATTVGADGDYHPLEVNANGRLWCSALIDTALPAGANAIGKLAANSGVTIGAVEIAAAQTLGTVTTVSTVTNLSQLGGTAIAMNTGVRSAGTQRVTIATDDVIPASQSGTWTVGLSAAQTLATVTSLTQMNGQAIAMGTGVRSAGTQRVTIATDDVVPASQSGTWTVQPGNTANTTPWLVAEQAATSGGYSLYSFLSTAAVQAAAVKASAGQVYGLHFFNNSATVAYVRLYNMTTTPGTGDTVVYRAMVPANTSAAGFVVNIPAGIAFSTGIGIRVSAAIADNDATALAANVVTGNVLYK